MITVCHNGTAHSAKSTSKVMFMFPEADRDTVACMLGDLPLSRIDNGRPHLPEDKPITSVLIKYDDNNWVQYDHEPHHP